jgi:hypothetical protein
MTPSNDELATLGVGLSTGAGSALNNLDGGVAVGLFGITLILVAIGRKHVGERSDDRDLVDGEGAR